MNSANPFDNHVTSYTCKTFGECVRIRREQLNISLREMAKKIGITSTYLSYIERGQRPAPNGCRSEIDYMSKIAEVLNLNSTQKKNFEIMAYMSRGSMDSYFEENPNALKFFIQAMKAGWNDKKWEETVSQMFN